MNTLKDWLDQESGRAAALARHLDVVPSFVHKMATGEKPVPVQRMAAIEAFTGGAVTRQSLRPHDWHQIWPELAATEPQPCMTSNNPDRIELRVELPSVDVSVLDGCCNATGRSRADVVRCILSDWSLARIHEAKVICRVAGVNPFESEPGRK